jgi:hypothetical protein
MIVVDYIAGRRTSAVITWIRRDSRVSMAVDYPHKRAGLAFAESCAFGHAATTR